jgi:hypothetical protein
MGMPIVPPMFRGPQKLKDNFFTLSPKFTATTAIVMISDSFLAIVTNMTVSIND